MSAAELLAECQARDIDLHAHGGQLDIDAPAGAMTDELLQRLRHAKPEVLAMLDDGDGSKRDEREAIVCADTAPAAEVDAALQAAIDGFEKLYRGDAGQDIAAPRPRSAVSRPVEWPGAAADFCLLLAPDDLPPAPFRLNGWTEVRDAEKLLRSLRADILRGPGGPRARYGALQADLEELQRFALAAHDCDDLRGNAAEA